MPGGSPVYRTITGRPDGVGGLGVEFNGSSYLQNFRLGLPETSFSAIGGDATGTLDYTGIADRGMQFWVRPNGGATPQSLVVDTNQHGARISAAGNFSMRYNGLDFDSGVAANAGVWRHIAVVRPAGGASGSRMFIDGIVVAAAPGGYNGGDTSRLVVGANTAGDEDTFSGGTAEFFRGVIDDLSLFVIGRNAAANYGAYNLPVDNQFVDFKLSNVVGDVDNDGDLDQTDKNNFIAGWMTEKRVNGIRVGDLESSSRGDLNFDGITNIFDLAIIQSALTAAGIATISGAELAGLPVPEPTAGVIALTLALSVRRARSRRR